MTVTKLKMKLMNKSGIYPAGDRVLIRVDQLDDDLETELIELPDEVKEKYQSGQATGTLVAVGPDAFQHRTEFVYHAHDNGHEELIERRVSRYSEDFAKPGDRISFAEFQGKRYTGKDGKEYLVIKDEDITCKVDDEVKLTHLNIRKGVGLD